MNDPSKAIMCLVRVAREVAWLTKSRLYVYDPLRLLLANYRFRFVKILDIETAACPGDSYRMDGFPKGPSHEGVET